jgi:hypothetical protein
VHFLRTRQLPSGEFATFIARDPALQRECRYDNGPFATTFVLHALDFVDGVDAVPLVRRGLAYLAEAQEGPGLWRHEGAHSPHHFIAPPDLDDTACVSWTLRQHGVAFHPNEDLVARQRSREGLFLTYVQPRDYPWGWLELFLRHRHRQLLRRYRWVELFRFTREVDINVNANVVLYLGEDERTLRAREHLNAVVARGEEGSSLYYASPLAFCYMLSRAYFHGIASLAPAAALLPQRVLRLQRPDGSFDQALGTALAACTLLNCGRADEPGLERAVRHLVATQTPDGSWRRSAFYTGLYRYYWWGSEELTTALCVEALARYARAAGGLA